MFAVLSSRLRFAVLLFATSVGLVATSAASADATDTCFNYLSAQDYARAETAAKAVLQRSGLERTEQRYAYLCLGQAYRNMGRTRDALPAFQQVEALSKTTEELSIAYNYLGVTYADIGDLDRAELYDQRALKAFKELGDKSNEAGTLSNLAMVVGNKGEVERALVLFKEALSVLPDEAKKSAILNNIAVIYMNRKDYVRADQMLRQALDIDRRNGNAHGAAQWQLNLSFSLKQQGKWQAAEKELTAGLNALHLLGDKHWEASACVGLAQLAVAQKKPANGLRWDEWYAKAEGLYREIGDTASANKIANLLAGK